MTFSSPLFRNAGAISLAFVWTFLTFGAAITPAPAEARTTAAFYTAELAAPATEAHTIAGGVVWLCEGTSCTAAKGTSRPVIMCARLTREVGEVTAFAAGGEALAADKLARCNGN